MRRARPHFMLRRCTRPADSCVGPLTAGSSEVSMHRLRAILLTLIIAGLAVRIVWIAISPMVPYAIGGLVGVYAVGALYYRKRRW